MRSKSRFSLLTSTAIVALLLVSSAAALADDTSGEGQRAEKAKPQQTAVFVDGALAVPGAPSNTQTVPAKFSEQNAADDRLPTWGFTFNHLTAEQRRAIYESIVAKYAGSGTGRAHLSPDTYAVLGAVLPDSVQLLPPTPDMAAKIADVKWYLAAMIGDKAVLVEPASKAVVGVFAP